jgi:putative ABC transport system permease protein
VVAVVPQESSDDYFDATIHRADLISGADEARLMIRAQPAPAGYFSLMGIPVVRGRDFDVAHREEPSAIVIGTAAANRLWPGADPIGRRLVTLSPTRRGTLLTVVGVVDAEKAGLREAGDEIRVFVPDVRVTGHFLIRTQAPAQPMLPVIRAVAVAEAPDLPIVNARTIESIEAERRTSLSRAVAGIAGAGALALFLSAIGLYAVVALAVRQRVREIGIRTALGANRQQVVQLFLMRGLRLSVLGMVVGLTLSVIVVRLISALQGEEPSPHIVGLAVLIACVAIAVALIATWIPARRAASVDPLVALRID